MKEDAKDYVIRDFQKGDFRDQNGNYWCDAAFEGVGEPVKMVVKDPMKFTNGMTVYGYIRGMSSKAGKPYQRFYRVQKEEAPAPQQASQKTGSYQPRDDMAIRAQWAIGQAVQLQNGILAAEPSTQFKVDWLETEAKNFFAMVDRVKAGEPASTADMSQDEFNSLVQNGPWENVPDSVYGDDTKGHKA
jgi:hypothetical protein